MDLTEFYNYQDKARQVTTSDEALAASRHNSHLYDLIIRPWLPGDTGADIYEAACGPGILLHWLKSRDYVNVTASDFSPVQVLLAGQTGYSVTLQDSISQLKGRAPESLDCIIALDFFEHLSKENFLDFIFESYRTLRKGGRLILRGPNGDSPVVGRALYNDITHVTTYTSIAATAVLNMIGFKRVQFKDDTLASRTRLRWISVPISWVAQKILRQLLRFATHENIQCLSASFFICASKE